ncbi:hypothetical protein [Chamaesiphon sp. VAR_48_metabat_135_sub]|uniref:hypothetical protein n=1 Tax=Chamaesiphon sp. VAR_48_metabat_135_sub TaxID=2964699 RepID=UPI00286D6327|nr:hypothetical protein [Chamaesiphon sp. VAR_48_metabat_135_sub]
MEPVSLIAIGAYHLFQFIAANGIIAGAGALLTATLVICTMLWISEFLNWFRNTLRNINASQKNNNVNVAMVSATIGKISQMSASKTVNAGLSLGGGLELMKAGERKNYEETYIVQLIKDSRTGEVFEVNPIKFEDLDEELLDAHRSDAIVLWT